MPLAIVLRVAPGDAEALRPFVEKAAVFEAAPSMAALGYPPHVTLGVYEEGMEGLAEAAAALFSSLAPLTLTFERLAWFDADPLVLYAAPEASRALDAVHARLHAIVAPERCCDHYRPGRFVPHCTLASDIDAGRREPAIAFARAARPRLRLTFDRGELVAFPPARVVGRWPLAAPVQG